MTDATHDFSLRSWVESANRGSDFPIQNLPFGIFSRSGSAPRAGVAIGNRVADLSAMHRARLFEGAAAQAAGVCDRPSLNALMSLGHDAMRALRVRLVELLRIDSPHRAAVEPHLVAMRDVVMHLPASIGDYTDYYASVHHATNVGSMFRPDNPLLPNYKWVPIGYHGRASSIVVSSTDVMRPSGQTKEDNAKVPSFGPTKRLDYEMEVGAFIGQGNPLGEPVPISAAIDRVFGLVLVNDWSARDIQAWEYQPLGPFLAKNFATSVSPWVVTLEALEPFRTAAYARPEGDPAPLPHLDDPDDRSRGGFDITLEVWLSSQQMRERGMDDMRLSRGSFRDMYWTLAQMLAHHTSNGCNMQAGDLIASGTVSGEEKDSRGSMLELTWRGTEPITLSTGEERRFLGNGDEVILRGYCEREGYARIGFGDCRGIVVAGP